jgi:hypothetical protein
VSDEVEGREGGLPVIYEKVEFKTETNPERIASAPSCALEYPPSSESRERE